MTRITGKSHIPTGEGGGAWCGRLFPRRLFPFGGRAVRGGRGVTVACVSSWLSFLLLVLAVAAYFANFRTNSSSSMSDPFARPFCDPTCHEEPDRPSPRTPYSARSKDQYDRWWAYFRVLNGQAEEYAEKRTRMAREEAARLHPQQPASEAASESATTATTLKMTRPLILLGDSITEAWVGTGSGVANPRTDGIPAVLDEELSGTANLDPLVLAISGDQTQHLLYRLQNGHLRAPYASAFASAGGTASAGTTGVRSPTHPNDDDGDDGGIGGGAHAHPPAAVFVVMIGTNNLGSGMGPGPTAAGVLAVADLLLEWSAASGGYVLLFEVLPRGDGPDVLPALCPPRCDVNGHPLESFLPDIDDVNRALRDGVDRLNGRYPNNSNNNTVGGGGGSSETTTTPRLTLVDCGRDFLSEPGDGQYVPVLDIRQDLMPDLLHPNTKGHRILAACIRHFLEGLDP